VCEARGAEELVANVPLATLVLEGIELAGFIDHYWEPNAELGLTGLSEYVRAQFTQDIAREIRELSLVVAELQARYNATVEPPLVAPVERGEAILTELHQALAFLFDDGVDAREDKEFARMKGSFSDRSSHDTLAASLDGSAHFAAKFRKRLKAIPRFDHQLIDEALVVARRLSEQNAIKESKRDEKGRQILRAQRARVTRLLYERMTVARRTIRYAYADHPEVVKRATSDYRRERRQKQRGRKQETPEE
jgi:hypothetical protein